MRPAADMQVVVPEELRGTVIAGCHENKEGHASVLKTFQKVREQFYWPGMFMDVQRYLKFCPECGLNAQRRSKAPITQHIEENAPGETVVMDFNTPLPKGQGLQVCAGSGRCILEVGRSGCTQG